MGTIKKVPGVYSWHLLIYTFELIKFSHSIFALPFALASMLVAAQGWPELRTLLLILAAMVTARSAAMAFNRLVDAPIDAKNPRTQNRHLPQGLLSKQYVVIFTILCSALFFWTCGAINQLALLLSPFALAVLLGYSVSKRFTWLTHFWLGLSLGIAPLGAWIAVQGTLAITPIWLGLAVLFWVAGFDIIYATQDYEFDRQNNVSSLVSRFGLATGLKVARLCHVLTLIFLFLFGWSAGLHYSYWVLVSLIGTAFLWEHSLVKPNDLNKVNAAFFTINGFVSLIFLIGIWITLQV